MAMNSIIEVKHCKLYYKQLEEELDMKTIIAAFYYVTIVTSSKILGYTITYK